MVETYLKCVHKAMIVDTNQLVLQCQAYQEQEMLKLRRQLIVKEANLLDLKCQLDVVNANKEQEILELKCQLDAVKLEKQQEVDARELQIFNMAEKVDTPQSQVYDDEEKQKQWRQQYHQESQHNNEALQEELVGSKKDTVRGAVEVTKTLRLVRTTQMEKEEEIAKRKLVEVQAINSRTEV
ncbi:unnamed protein product [Calypogeia fissa]